MNKSPRVAPKRWPRAQIDRSKASLLSKVTLQPHRCEGTLGRTEGETKFSILACHKRTQDFVNTLLRAGQEGR